MWLVEGEAKPEHARPLAPAGDDLFAVRALQIEMSEDAELVGMLAHRFDSEDVDGFAERAGRMDHRAIDPGRGHLGRSEEHTSELQSRGHLVWRLLLVK